ncbi:MAG: hypothetical protein HQM08_06885 [Candidatus Riflebacteria bacterium]|nr:hypothetical protein [Candidatus Riflebacteria bacterium]
MKKMLRLIVFLVISSMMSISITGCVPAIGAFCSLVSSIGGAVAGIGAIVGAFGNKSTGQKLQQAGVGMAAAGAAPAAIEKGFTNIGNAYDKFKNSLTTDKAPGSADSVPTVTGDPDASNQQTNSKVQPNPPSTSTSTSTSTSFMVGWEFSSSKVPISPSSSTNATSSVGISNSIEQTAKKGDLIGDGITRISNSIKTAAQAGNQAAQGVIQTKNAISGIPKFW